MSIAASKRKAGGQAAAGPIDECGAVSGAGKRMDDLATSAYYMAEARGFAPGRELDDWLEAEAKYNAARERKS